MYIYIHIYIYVSLYLYIYLYIYLYRSIYIHILYIYRAIAGERRWSASPKSRRMGAKRRLNTGGTLTSAATHPGVGGGTHRRRATFERC